jgi:hypothetical protein
MAAPLAAILTHGVGNLPALQPTKWRHLLAGFGGHPAFDRRDDDDVLLVAQLSRHALYLGMDAFMGSA